MGERILTNEYIEKFASYLQNEEKSCNTQEKYIRDVHAFFQTVGNGVVTKEVVIEYKMGLISRDYAIRSINSMLASLLRLVNAAGSRGNERLNLLLQTICGTGIRVSELPYITVEAAKSGEAKV